MIQNVLTSVDFLEYRWQHVEYRLHIMLAFLGIPGRSLSDAVPDTLNFFIMLIMQCRGGLLRSMKFCAKSLCTATKKNILSKISFHNSCTMFFDVFRHLEGQ